MAHVMLASYGDHRFASEIGFAVDETPYEDSEHVW